MGFCVDGERQVERRVVLYVQSFCTALSRILTETYISFSTLESGPSKQQFKDLTVLQVLPVEYMRVAFIVLRMCPRLGVVLTRPQAWSSRVRMPSTRRIV